MLPFIKCHFSYTFDRLRKEAEGKYESYTDMGLNEWIKMKIVVQHAQAKLYLNDNPHPVLIVNDLKPGAANSNVTVTVQSGSHGLLLVIQAVAFAVTGHF